QMSNIFSWRRRGRSYQRLTSSYFINRSGEQINTNSEQESFFNNENDLSEVISYEEANLDRIQELVEETFMEAFERGRRDGEIERIRRTNLASLANSTYGYYNFSTNAWYDSVMDPYSSNH